MESISRFASVNSGGSNGSGYGYGNGNGRGRGNGGGSNGNGSGFGDGNGDGSGDGSGYGSGYGFGFGSGRCKGRSDGSGIKSINNISVYLIDGVETAITNVKGNIAKGFIVNGDLTLTPTFVAKGDGYFAHGDTLRKALQALDSKRFADMSIEQRISEFLQAHNLTDKYPASDFFDWHNRLTNSCEPGRKAFAKRIGVDLEHDTFTVAEFIVKTRDGSGGEVIRRLEEAVNDVR